MISRPPTLTTTLEALKESARTLLRHWRLFFMLAWIPVAGHLALDFAMKVVITTLTAEDTISLWALSLGSMGLRYAVAVPLITVWFRLALLAEPARQQDLNYRVGRREWRFAGWAMLIGGVGIVLNLGIEYAFARFHMSGPYLLFEQLRGPAVVHNVLLGLWTWTPHAVVYALLLRFAFVFPASAIGGHVRLDESWRAMQGHVVALVLAYLAVQAATRKQVSIIIAALRLTMPSGSMRVPSLFMPRMNWKKKLYRK